MTNKEYISSCSTEELAMMLTDLIVCTVEVITKRPVEDDYIELEYLSMLKYLKKEFEQPSEYLN